jgi:hypothetical protein
MAILAALMISDVPYPAMPSVGFRTLRQWLGTLVVGGSIVLLLVRREEFIFPALLAYVLFGAVKWVVLGFAERSASPDEIYWEHENDEAPPREERRAAFGRPSTDVILPAADESIREEREQPEEAPQVSRRRRRRRGRGSNRPHGSNAPTPPRSSPIVSPIDTPKGPTE